ncbi:MAG TPA: hypothetical protein VGH89_00155 [Pseudonocardia sp.]
MNLRAQRWCTWCGPAFTVLFAIGFWPIAGLVPPPSPDQTPAQFAALFAAHDTRIRIGLQLCMIASALFFPFVAQLSVQLRRIEGEYSPLAYAQLAAGTGSTLVFIFPVMNLQSAAYRADRAPELIQAINDMSWIPFVGLLCVPAMQNICLAIGILTDTAEHPVFPRWSGYLNIWVAASFLPAVLLVFVKSGPVAWNGIFSWWLGAAAFFGWVLVMTGLLLRAINHQARTGQPAERL